MALLLDITRFDGLYDTDIHRERVPWDALTQELTKHQEVKAKTSARGWSPVRYRLRNDEGVDWTRGNKGVEEVTAIVFDVDHQPPNLEMIQDLEYVVYTTYSHTEDDPHHRIVIPLAEPVPVGEWPGVWRSAVFWLQPDADPACKDVSRYYYVPSCPPGGPRSSTRHPGTILDWRGLRPIPPAMSDSPEPPRESLNGHATPEGDRPGDLYNQETDWANILHPAGWRVIRRVGNERFWLRPENGIPRTTGWSATTGHSAADNLHVFTSNGAPFAAGENYTKFRAYSLLNHRGNDSEAASMLYRERYEHQRLSGTGNTKSETTSEAEPTEAAWTFRVYSGADFFRLDLPPITWQAAGYLREKSVVFCYGPPGTLKTYLALDLALAIATGGKFLQTFTCPQGSVLFLQEDTTENDFQQAYFNPMVQALGIELHQLETTFFVAPPSGLTVEQAERLAIVETWIAEHRPAFIVADAFYLFHSTEGMTGKDLAPIMRVFKRWRAAYGCTVFLVDHDRKSVGRASDDGDPVDKLYGGRAKSAAADALWEMRRIKGAKDQAFLHINKIRGAKPPDAVRIRLHRGALQIEGSKPEAAEGTVKEVYEWFVRQGGNRTKRQIGDALNISQRSVDRAIGYLFRAGRIEKRGREHHAELWGVYSPGDHWMDEDDDAPSF